MALVYDPVTRRYIDDATRAAAMQAQLSQPVTGPRGVVALRDPNVGLPLPAQAMGVPLDTRYADDAARAAGMQTQFNQPVTGPDGVVSFAPPPTQTLIPGVPAAAQTQLPLNPGVSQPPGVIQQGLGGVVQTVAGGLAAAPALGFDAARRGLTNLAGGDPNTLPGGPTQLSDAAFGAISQGVDDVTGASASIRNSLQSGLRGILGVQPAQPPAAVAQVQQPASPATVVQPVQPEQPVAPAPVAQPVIPTAPVQPALAAVPTEVTPVNVQGLPDRTGFTGGGFGTDASGNPLNASQYLAQKRAEDQQFVARRQQAYDALTVQQGLSRLQDARSDPVKYRQLLAEQRLIQGGIAGSQALTASTEKARADNATQLGLAGINNTAAAKRQLAANEAEIQKATQVANLTGQYGLQGAQIKADATNAKTAALLGGPAAILARAQAQSVAERQAAARARFEQTGDLAAYVADLKDGQEPAAQKNPFGVDALTGLPFTPQSAALAESIRLQQLQDQLRKAQTK